MDGPMHYLSAALVNISWQICVLGALVFLLTYILRLRSPVMRYNLWMLVMLSPLFLPLLNPFLPDIDIGLLRGRIDRMDSAAVSFQGYIERDVRAFSQPPEGKGIASGSLKPEMVIGGSDRVNGELTSTSMRIPAREILMLLWLLGICLMSMRFVKGIHNLHLLRRETVSVENTAILNLLDELRKALGVRRQVRLAASDLLGYPVSFGWYKPLILLPSDMIESASLADIRMTLIHELAHIRRYDYPINMMASLLRIPFFFHPVLLFAFMQLRSQQEHICDGWVIRLGEGRKAYASCLLRQAGTALLGIPLALGGFENLKRRVNMILNSKQPISVGLSGKGWAFMLIACLILAALAATTQLLPMAKAEKAKGEVRFADPVVESAIRRALGKPEGPIMKSDLLRLKRLEIRRRTILDLSGIEGCENLETLTLASTKIEDITPLKSLTKLRKLDLTDNRISDITPLNGLRSLRWLNLVENRIEDITPLRNLTNLSDLYLKNNRIKDLSPLKGLKKLRHLSMGGNDINDLSPLSGLTELQELYLWGNRISEIGPLGDLTKLRVLQLHTNRISDITSLGGLVNLENLNLNSNRISDISSLQNLTKLQKLYLGMNLIADVKPLKGLTRLRELDLSGNRIADLSPLSGLKNLKSLMLESNNIEDIKPLSKLTGLQMLFLGNNRITDVSPLSELKGLKVLDLRKNLISDASPLGDLKLRALYLDDNQIEDISFLANMRSLGVGWSRMWKRDGVNICLGLSNNRISDIKPLVIGLILIGGGGVDLRGNPLNDRAYRTYIPALRERSPNVLYDPRP